MYEYPFVNFFVAAFKQQWQLRTCSRDGMIYKTPRSTGWPVPKKVQQHLLQKNFTGQIWHYYKYLLSMLRPRH